MKKSIVDKFVNQIAQCVLDDIAENSRQADIGEVTEKVM